MTDSAAGPPAPPPPPAGNGRHDVLTHRIVVLSLSLTVVLTGLNMTVLQALGKDVPPALAHLGSVAIGALAMTLASVMKQD